MEPSVEYEQLQNESGTLEKPPKPSDPQIVPPQLQQPPQQQQPQQQPRPQMQVQPQFQPVPQVQYQPVQGQFQPVQGQFQPMHGQAVAIPVVQYYAQQPVAQPQVAVAQPVAPQVQIHNVTTTTAQPPEKWPWCHVVTSMFAFFCCQPFGLIALVSSLLAYADHKSKDFKRSQSKRKIALGFGIASIVIGCLSCILAIALVAWAVSLAASVSNNYYNSGSYDGYDDCFSDYGYMNSTVWNGTDWACASAGTRIPVSSLVSVSAPLLLLVFALFQARF